MVTDIFPVEPDPTTAKTVVGDITVYEAAGVSPNLTAVVFVRLVPVIVTIVDSIPEVGANEVIVGTAIYENAEKEPTPDGVETDTLPVAPLLPTTADISVEETTEKVSAGIPPNLTSVAPVKFFPVIFTVVP